MKFRMFFEIYEISVYLFSHAKSESYKSFLRMLYEMLVKNLIHTDGYVTLQDY